MTTRQTVAAAHEAVRVATFKMLEELRALLPQLTGQAKADAEQLVGEFEETPGLRSNEPSGAYARVGRILKEA